MPYQRFLKQWFLSPIGQGVFKQEQALLDKELARLFGYYLLQLGSICDQSLVGTSRVKTKVIVDHHADFFTVDNAVVADLDFLPFRSESIDVVLLPHTLEAVADPYHLVRQVDSMLMAEGYLVISGFNPYGCSLIRAKLSSSRSGLRQGNLLTMHRVIDWLNLLGYEIQVAQHGSISCFGRSGSSFWSWIEGLEKRLDKMGIHFGNVYCVVAKKRVVTPKPVGLDWKLANWLPIHKGRPVASCDQHQLKK